MSNTYNSRIITKTDTYDNWTAANPVLLNGELVAATGCADGPSTRFKLGDGATAFNSLAFVDNEIVAAMAVYEEYIANSVVVYVGSTAPASDVGSDGDLYIQLS